MSTVLCPIIITESAEAGMPIATPPMTVIKALATIGIIRAFNLRAIRYWRIMAT
ncbi:MAG: hypothetical protein HUU60_04980 [Armatimonadetes bacterium]|nr:hypothetical protein [Armatimonadota bacterium]